MENLFEKDWRFTRDISCEKDFMQESFCDENWEKVDVPHDWAIKGPFDEKNDAEITIIDVDGGREWKMVHPGRSGGLPHVGKGFYRKKFTLSGVKDKHIRIEFDGVMSWSKVYCNGEYVTGRPYGYASFSADITSFAKEGENILAVSAENLPGASRWYPGAGIYRHVRLIEEPLIHVKMWGTRIVTKENTVKIHTQIENPSGKEQEISFAILDKEGKCVAEKREKIKDTLDTVFTVENVEKWSVDKPVLYTLVTEIAGGRRETSFGFRDMKFDAHDGFFLNGKKMKFKGVCLHHDLGIIGAAVDRDVTQHRLKLLKSIGCNAIRTAHNPPDPELLDLCDSMGFLVICEAYDEWKLPKCPNGVHLYFDQWGEKDLRDMIRRDANHPSVMMWSIGNEIDEQYTADGPVMTKHLCAVCHDEDPSRPTTAGLNNGDDSITGGLFDDVDIKGFNYKPYIYSLYHHTFPDAPMYASESASTISSRGEYSDYLFEELVKKPNLQIDSFDLCNSPGATIPEHEFKGQDENPFVMGEFVWTGFDYLGEPTPYREEWPVRSAFYGIFDLCGMPKNRAYLYKSRWSEEKVLYLMPHWNWEGHKHVPVQCYTNYKTVELFVNGKSMGAKTRNVKKILGYSRLVWASVPYEKGEIRVKALDDKGNVLEETFIRTAGEPAGIKLEAERTNETLFVTTSIVDADGNLCPDADDLISFESNGKILAADGGNAASTDVFHTPFCKAFHGKCMCFVRGKENCRVKASMVYNGKTIISEITR